MGGILVTGISGFIGGHVWKLLAGREDTWGVTGATGNVPLRPEKQLTADLSVPGEIEQIIEDLRPRCIIHLAALSRPEYVSRHCLLAWRINNAATRELARAAAKVGARVIFTSSDQVFDGSHGHYAETDPPNPISVYGETKKAAERSILGQMVNSAVILRLNNVYGPPQFRGSSFSEWLLDREQRGNPITLFRDQFRSPVDVITVSQIIVELMDNPYTGILHIGGPNRVNRVAFGRMILKHMGRDVSGILEMNANKFIGDHIIPADTSFNPSKAKQILDTEIPTLDQGLMRTYGPAKAHF